MLDTPGTLLVIAPELSRALREHLEAHNVTLVDAPDTAAALTRIEIGEPADVILLDLSLPHGGGIALLKKVRARCSPLELPVIGLGRANQSKHIIEALSSGANDVITLPANPAVFLARVQAQLNTLKAHRRHLAQQQQQRRSPEADNPLTRDYAELAFLSRGGYATIYQARQRSTGQTVAIKLLHTYHLSQDTLARELTRFEREMVLIGQIQHPNVVRLIDAGRINARQHREGLRHLHDDENTLREATLVERPGDALPPEPDDTLIPFIVMEHLVGETLLGMLKRKRRLRPQRALGVLLPVISAVDTAHRHGVLHRDLKPSNIFLEAVDSGQLQPRVLDFGIAKLLREDAPQITLPETVVGTPSYMSPEQIRGAELTTASDQYALGVLLYVCLTGRVPHRGRTLIAILESILDCAHAPPSDFNPEITPTLERHILRAMREDPADRFPSLSAFAEALREVQDSLCDT